METPKIIESIPTDPELVRRRRAQIAHAALSVFAEKGFHKARVRDVAQAAGVAVGTIYEYVSTKEDILYLACEQSFSELEQELRQVVSKYTPPLDRLRAVIQHYYRTLDEMDQGILLLYRESQSLDAEGRRMLMRQEEEIRQLLEGVLTDGIQKGIFKIENPRLVAHDIISLGHMSLGLKRWALRNYLDVEQYIRLQTDLLISGIRAG